MVIEPLTKKTEPEGAGREVGPATFKHCDRIVPKTPQLVDHRQREILVGEEPGYAQSPSLHSFSRMSRAISSGCEPA